VKLQGFKRRMPFFPSSPRWRIRSASNAPALWNSSEGAWLIVNGFCKNVLNELPMEFAVEAKALLSVNLEGAVG
jgi:hypothetical protein